MALFSVQTATKILPLLNMVGGILWGMRYWLSVRKTENFVYV